MTTKKQFDDLTYLILGAAIEVHKAIGPGLLESVYHKCMKHELFLRQINFSSEQLVQIEYKGTAIESELRCDLVVEDKIAVEFKAVEAIAPIHEAKILTYMKLLKVPKGILINFNCINIFKDGQRTYVNELFQSLPER